MRQVRLFITEDSYNGGYDDGPSQQIIRKGVTDWEEISEEDYKLLKDNLYQISRKYNYCNILLIEKDPVSAVDRIASIKEWLQSERDRQEQEAAKRKAAAEEKALKRMLKKAGDEKRLLEELKKKYPDAV